MKPRFCATFLLHQNMKTLKSKEPAGQPVPRAEDHKKIKRFSSVSAIPFGTFLSLGGD